MTPEQWQEIPAFKGLAGRMETGSEEPLFIIDRLNLVNNADDGTNPMGVALFANALDVIRKIDLEYDSYANEFSLGRKRIFVASEMLTTVNGEPVFDPEDMVFYELPEDYFKNSDSKGAIHEVNMELRIEEHSRALLTGMEQLTRQISRMNGQALGTDKYEVDWHPGARPDHAVWQGRVWTYQQLVDVCGLGTGPGLLGWNCRHTYYPFLEGFSVRNYSDAWLAEMDRKEAQKVPFRGREYNAYEATQMQRRMETAMRVQREKVQLLKEGDADKDEVMLSGCKYQAMLDEYKAFSKKMNLPEQRERIYYDLRGRVAPSQRTYQKWKAGEFEKKPQHAAASGQKKEKVERRRYADMRGTEKKVANPVDPAIIKISNRELANGLPFRGIPDSVVDKVDENGKTLQRRVYDGLGRAKIDYDTSDHGLPSAHPTGAHKHVFDYSRKNPHGKPLALSEDELEQHKDIIKRGENYHEKE